MKAPERATLSPRERAGIRFLLLLRERAGILLLPAFFFNDIPASLPHFLCAFGVETRDVSWEGSRGIESLAWFRTDPSPVTLRLMKAPERATLSPRERAGIRFLLFLRERAVIRFLLFLWERAGILLLPSFVFNDIPASFLCFFVLRDQADGEVNSPLQSVEANSPLPGGATIWRGELAATGAGCRARRGKVDAQHLVDALRERLIFLIERLVRLIFGSGR